MAHHVRIREEGEWVAGPIDPDEMELIDSQLFGAINGDTGGDWSPAAAINIGGTHGITTSSSTPLIANGTTTLGGDVSVLGDGNHTFTCSRVANFHGNVLLGQGSSTEVTIGSLVTTYSAVTCEGALNANGATAFNGQTTLGEPDGGGATKTAIRLLGNLITNYSPVGSNPGRIQFYMGQVPWSGNAVRYVEDAAVEFVTNLGGSNRTLTLMHQNAGDGDWKIYVNASAANTITVYDQTNGILGTALQPGGIAICGYVASAGQWFAGTANP